jgi:hypothetical protein
MDRKQEKEFFFLHEQRGNVTENKGPLWKTSARSGNVIDCKGDKRI